MENGNNNQQISSNGKSVRKRKLLTDSEKLHAKCRNCQELGNIENLI